MCGFAGVWHTEHTLSHPLESDVANMARAIHHRGPDDNGLWCDRDSGFALTHQRLSVLDLSPAGHQPMHSATGRYVIAFNGEIYNHLSIRQQLERSNTLRRPWSGHSDTETLLASIEAWGLTAALKQSCGMFAFALWDRHTRSLSLARDRFGEKPLYWGWLHKGGQRFFSFASELSAFRSLPGVDAPQVNPQALQAFFQYGYINPPLCIYSGLQQLQPGHTVRLTSPVSSAVPEAWWCAKEESLVSQRLQVHLASQDAALEALEHTLRNVIREQSFADVPLGSFLSGGIDSSLITSLLQEQSSHPVQTFTIAFPDNAAFNEAPSAAAVAAHLGTQHTEVPVTTCDVLSLIPLLPRFYSEPFADSSQLPTYIVCREARHSGLTVALSGDGGDELFGGYNRHRLLPTLHRRLGSLPSHFSNTLACALKHMPTSRITLAQAKLNKLVDALRSDGSLDSTYASVISVWDNPSGDLLRPQWKSPFPSAHPNLPEAFTLEEKLMLSDVLFYLPADILVKVDRAAMASSLETRAPFLDKRVALLAWQIPLSLKLTSAGTSKWALRQLLYRYLPSSLVDRPKAGFAIPIGAWLRGPLRSWAEELLDPKKLREQGYLFPDTVHRVWNEHLAGCDHTSRIWTVLMWQAWLAEWM